MSSITQVVLCVACPEFPAHSGNDYIKEALENLGVRIEKKEVDLVSYEEHMWEIPRGEIYYCSTDSINLGDFAEKLQVFEDVTVHSSGDKVIFSILDWWL